MSLTIPHQQLSHFSLHLKSHISNFHYYIKISKFWKKMVALTLITPHSSSSCLQSKPYPNFVIENSTCCISISPVKFSTRRTRFTILSAATKPAKSPAEEEWKTKREVLLEKKVRSVDVKEALRLQKENSFVILDVRPEAEFKEGHPPGAINVQIYRLIKEWTAWDIARRVAFAFFGIFAGTEENPEFLQSMV
ncbi:putative Rhodanese-like domain-containing protein [Helianthus anomalus]